MPRPSMNDTLLKGAATVYTFLPSGKVGIANLLKQ